MKITKREAQDNKPGKKFKNVSAGKSEANMEVSSNREAISTSLQQQRGVEVPKMKHVDVISIVSPESHQDSISTSTEAPVLFSGDGILRQALLSFSYSGQEEKMLKDAINKKSDVDKAPTVTVGDTKLPCSSPRPLSPEIVQIPFASKTLTRGTFPSKSLLPGTVLAGSLPMGNLPLVSLPPVSLTPGAFSHGTLPLMSLTSGPLPPVSEIPRPGSIPSLSCSSLSSRSAISTGLSGSGIVASMPTSFGGGSGNIPILSEIPAYEVPQLGAHSLKVLVPLSNVSTMVTRTIASPIQTQTTSPSKESSVTLVYSSLPKMEPSILNSSHNLSQKVIPLPPMSEMKSRRASHLHVLSHGKINNNSGATVSNHGASSSDIIHEVVPVSTDILAVAGSTSQTNASVLASVSNGPTHDSGTNPIKLDESHDSTEELRHSDTIPSIAVSHSINFQTSNSSATDLNHVIIPVSSGVASGKVDDHHSLSTQDIGQIITIPLTSSAIYGHPVGISIPISGNAVPLSMPVQVSSGMLPMSCSLLPVSSSPLQVSASVPSTPITISENSAALLQASGSIRSYSSAVIPSISPSALVSNTTETQHSRQSTDISGLVTVTSSMILPISSTMTPVTAMSTTGISGVMIPVTCATDSVPVTSISVSVPSSSTTTTTTMVFATQNASIEPVAAYSIQSPAEILSQLSKAGVLPTMSSSQVSSVLSALAPDGCHLDLESDSSHLVELMSQQQVMQLSSSADKVSTLTQTEDLELGHTVELGCNMNVEPRDSKVLSVSNEVHLEEGDRLMEHHLHILNNAHERSSIVPASLPPSAPLAEKQPSISNLSSTGSAQVPVETAVIEHQVPVNHRITGIAGIESSALKQLPSMYPRIVPKLNSTSNELITASLTKNNLNPKLDVPKRGNESLARNQGGDLNCEQRIASVFIKQEDFENSVNQKVNNKVGNDGIPRDNVSRKRKIQDVNDRKSGSNCAIVRCSKESKKQNMKDVEMDNYVEQVACYKCKFCPFLTLEKKGVALHVQLVHSSQLPGSQQETRHNIKCPGCKNIFFTSKSLRVHLSQDHQVGDDELRTLVEVVIKSSCKEGKAKNKFNKKRRKSVAKNHPPVLSNPASGKNSGSKDMQDITNNIVDLRHSSAPEVSVDECSKIRVRNLNSETLPELAETSVSPNNIAIVNDVRDEDSLSSNGASDDVRDGTLVIDDDPLIQQKRARVAVEEMIKTDAEQVTGQDPTFEIVDCDPEDNTLRQKEQRHELKPNPGTSPTTRKKRGRPKGSKNVPVNGYRKSTPLEKEFGYRCDIDGCAVRLRSHDNIEYHRRCHHGEKFLCPECSQETIHWNALSTHLWRYHVIDMELFACDQCSYKSNSYSKLMNLHRRIHGDERPFLCDICGKGFKNPKQMRNHKAIHVAKQKQKSGPIGECDVCGRTFSNPRILRIHKDNVHGKLRPHLCNFCGYSASSRSTLKMHMRLHTGEKPFHCDECEYATADHNSLRRHKMRHSGDKPYKCPHCSYACIQSSTYKAHLNTKHPGMETGLMFSCHLCSFRSVRKDNYLAHIAEHENGSNPSNRHRKHNSPKSQSDSNKTTQQREIAPRVDKPCIPVIINISNIITPMEQGEGTLAEANVESSGNVHLIYNSTSVEGLLQQSSETVEEGRFGVEMSSDSVIHLVEDLDTNSDSNGQTVAQNVHTLCVANIETVSEMPLTPEFEAEQITGDIQDIKEPQELKYKVTEDMAS